MALGDTYFVRVDAYAVSTTDRTQRTSLGTMNLYIPYFDGGSYGGNGNIIEYGYPVSKYYSFLEHVPDAALFSAATVVWSGWVGADQNALNYFPLLRNYDLGDPSKLHNVLYINPVTGYVYSPSLAQMFPTIGDFENGTNITTVERAFSVTSDGSGATKGALNAFTYTGYEGSLFTQFARFNLLGLTSTTNTIKINSYSIESQAVRITAWNNFLSGALPVVPPSSDDPYGGLTPTGPGGGTSIIDYGHSDFIEFPDAPEVSAVGTGFISLWSPTEQQMLDLSSYLWQADPLYIDFWRKLIANPIELIYGLSIIPLDLDAMGLIGGTDDVVVGLVNTHLKMNYLNSQWVVLDCGTLDISEVLGGYTDYDPYTRIDIFLPYIGVRPLKVDDFMPGTMQVKYIVDLLTGTCVALISSTKSEQHEYDDETGVMYQFTGNCATQVPVTAEQFAEAVRAGINMVAAVGTFALLAGAGGAGAAGAAAATEGGVAATGGGSAMVPYGTFASYNTPQAVEVGAKTGQSLIKKVGQVRTAASGIENVMGLKPSAARSGVMGASAGLMGVQTPYLIITRPRIAHPEDQNKYTGYPSFMTQQLSELTGFTQIEEIHLEALPCTAEEQAEIEELLKTGVIF